MAKKKRTHTPAESEEASIIRDIFHSAVRTVQKNVDHPRGATIYDLSGNLLRRRKAAAYSLLPEIQKRYGHLYPDNGIVRPWAAECSAMGHSVDGADHLYFITLAAAIWMLDELQHTGNLKTALSCFSKDWERIRAIPLPPLSDACHSEIVIRGMMDLIRERDPRDNPFQFYINDTSAKRTEPVRHAWSESDAEEASPRTRFNRVMSLIHPVVKERAVNRFLAKFWEFLSIYFECDASLYKAHRDLMEQSDAIMAQCSALHEKILAKPTQAAVQRLSPVIAKPQPPQLNLNLSGVGPSFGPSDQDLFGMGGISRLKRMVDQGLQLEDRAAEMETKRLQLAMTAHVAQMIPYEDAVDAMGSSAAQRFLQLEVDDPYETCFAYLCLIEAGSDVPWAYNGALAVLMAALRKLPWNASALELGEVFDWHDDMEEDEPDPEEDKEDGETWQQTEALPAPLDWTEKKAALYRLNYRNDPLYTPVENPWPEWRLNIPQLIFGLTGLVMPRTVSDHDGMAEEFTNAGVEKGLAKGLELYLQLALDTQVQQAGLRDSLSHMCHQPHEHLQKDAEDDDTDKEALQSLQERLKELKKASDTYREAAYQAEREAARLRKELDNLAAKAEREHTELAALRELVFKQANASGEAEAPQNESSSQGFPYMVKKRVVAFGGHDTWRKAIKPLLPNVTFVNREQQPNADMIRAADVVWIQANALSHRSFYKIINVVRTSQIPLRYFGFASAIKCAMQVVEDDMAAD